MKNFIKLFGITVLAAVIVFAMAGCSDGGGGGGGGGSLGGTSFTKTFTGVDSPDAVFSHFWNGGSDVHSFSNVLVDPTNAEVKVQNRTLTITLGAVKDPLLTVDDLTGWTLNPPDLRVYGMLGFYNDDDPSAIIKLGWAKDDNNRVCFVYANKDGTIIGDDGYGAVANMTLKAGWNTILVDFDNETYTSSTPNASYKWEQE